MVCCVKKNKGKRKKEAQTRNINIQGVTKMMEFKTLPVDIQYYVPWKWIYICIIVIILIPFILGRYDRILISLFFHLVL